MDLQDAQMIVAEHMDGILECFKRPAKITVCVRRPGLPEQDFMMTNDRTGLAVWPFTTPDDWCGDYQSEDADTAPAGTSGK